MLNSHFLFQKPKWIRSFFLIGMTLSLVGVSTFSLGQEIRADDLGLTSGQIQTLRELQIQFHRELTQIRKKMMIRRMELRTLTYEENRAEKGEEMRNEIRSLMLQARERSLFYRQEAFRVLTPDQQKRISAESELGFHCGRWFHRGGRWRTGRGGAFGFENKVERDR